MRREGGPETGGQARVGRGPPSSVARQAALELLQLLLEIPEALLELRIVGGRRGRRVRMTRPWHLPAPVPASVVAVPVPVPVPVSGQAHLAHAHLPVFALGDRDLDGFARAVAE